MVEAGSLVEEVQEAVRRSTGPLSVGGGHFSMGGQTASPGSLHLDMRRLNAILEFSPVNRSIRVQSGARWCDIQHFIDPHGLGGPLHKSSAYDIAMLARYGMSLSRFRDVVKTGSYTAKGARTLSMYNTNALLSTYPAADGVKTGFTDEAGRTLAASATKNGHRVYVVLLNDQNRDVDARALLDWAFGNFTWP